MESFYFVLNKAMEAFQTEMNVLGYTFSFYNVFWWTIICCIPYLSFFIDNSI